MKKNLLFSGLVVLAAIAAATTAGTSKELKLEQILTQDGFEEGFAGTYLASQYARRSGDFSAAVRYLELAYEKDPTNTELAAQLQGMLLLNGQVREAVDVAETIHKHQPNEAVAALLLTLNAIKRDDAESASEIIHTSFKSSNGQLWLPLLSAWLDIAQGTLNKPVDIKDIKSAKGRAAMVVHYHLALINDMAGFEEEATHNFLEAAKDDNPPKRLMLALSDFYERSGKPKALKKHVDEFKAEYSNESAANVGINGVNDGIAEVLYTMGSIMLSANLTQDAAIYLQLALYMKPDFPIVQLTLADSYSSMQQYEMANSVYGKIDPHHRLYSSAQINRAVNYHRMGNIDRAVELLNALSKDNKNRYIALVTKGDILRENMRFESAIEAYDRAVKQIKKFDNEHWALLFARGASHERLKNWNEAERDLEKALKLSGEQPEVLNYLGYLWLLRGKQVKEAKGMISRALSQRPNDPQIMDSMGWAYYLTGEYGKAARLLEKALNMIPSDPTVNEHLGDVYWQQGRKTEARFQWERSLMFSPAPDQVEVIEKKIKEGLSPPNFANVKAPIVASGQPAVNKATR